MSPKRFIGEQSSLLSATDIEQPLSFENQIDAQATLTLAGRNPDPVTTEAVAYYQRKRIQQLTGNTALGGDGVGERVQELLEELPQEIEESDLLARLVSEMSGLQTSQPSSIGQKLRRIFSARRPTVKLTTPAVRGEKSTQSLVAQNRATVQETADAEARKTKKIANRITSRAIKKIGDGDFPFTVKGGRLGLLRTMHSPAVYAVVAESLKTRGVRRTKVYNVKERRSGEGKARHSMAHVMDVSGSELRSRKTTSLNDPFTDPSGFKTNAIYGGNGRYAVEQVYPEVFWMS